MANYYGSARSNYFRVKNAENFLADLKNLSGVTVQKSTKRENCFVLLGSDADGYNWNVYETPDSDEDDVVSIELPQWVAPYLADDEVAIFMESGAEKLRYVIGYATAVNNKGDIKSISLGDIYKEARLLTSTPDAITTAEY